MSINLNILVVDDSVIYRKNVSDIFNSIKECTSVTTAANADIALKKIMTGKIDIVITDINMPKINGFELQQMIKEKNSSIKVILMSSENYSQASLTISALNNGAIDFIQKPTEGDLTKNKEILAESIYKLLSSLYSDLSIDRSELHKQSNLFKAPPPSKHVTPQKPISTVKVTSGFKILVIGVSTGGPQALGSIIPYLPASFPLPVIIVQHMPANFTRSLGETLDKKSAIKVKEAENGEIIKPGNAYIAPGGKQMKIAGNGQLTVSITDDPPENSCKPSVDYTFRSLSECFNNPVLSIILTGMGSDGLSGVEFLKTGKCFTITQSKETCVVYGMPKAVDEARLSDKSVDLQNIAGSIMELVR